MLRRDFGRLRRAKTIEQREEVLKVISEDFDLRAEVNRQQGDELVYRNYPSYIRAAVQILGVCGVYMRYSPTARSSFFQLLEQKDAARWSGLKVFSATDFTRWCQSYSAGRID